MAEKKHRTKNETAQVIEEISRLFSTHPNCIMASGGSVASLGLGVARVLFKYNEEVFEIAVVVTRRNNKAR